MSSVANSLAVASSINNEVADDIVNELASRIDNASVRRTVDEIIVDGIGIEEETELPSLSWYEEVVTDEKARETVEDVVERAAETGRISEKDKQEILQGLRDSGSVPSVPSVPRTIIRRRDEKDIERLLREIQKPEESMSNMALIQYRVFKCLGILN